LLGVEGIIQRESGTYRLLFLLEPRLNQDGSTEFGPYAYRSNAAQYFNLLWPLCLGYWWILQRHSTDRTKSQNGLLFCVALMAACPIISTSRGGALVSAGMLLLTLIYLAGTIYRSSHSTRPQPFIKSARSIRQLPPKAPVASSPPSDHRSEVVTAGIPVPSAPAHRATTGPLLLFLGATLALGLGLGWQSLAPRMAQFDEGLAGRTELHNAPLQMAGDYPLYGTGPGTYASVFQLYRFSEKVIWFEQVHDDWLETRITFGWLGFGALVAALGVVALRGFFSGGLRGLQPLKFFGWVSLGGCLLHARFDFPLQIHSTLFLFLAVCAILLNLGRGPGDSHL
jgi:hypothetical protein